MVLSGCCNQEVSTLYRELHLSPASPCPLSTPSPGGHPPGLSALSLPKKPLIFLWLHSSFSPLQGGKASPGASPVLPAPTRARMLIPCPPNSPCPISYLRPPQPHPPHPPNPTSSPTAIPPTSKDSSQLNLISRHGFCWADHCAELPGRELPLIHRMPLCSQPAVCYLT